MTEAPQVSIRHEFPSCVHVAVTDPQGNMGRSEVMRARNLASRHYGRVVGHYVSSGWSDGASTFVFTRPDESAPKVREPRSARSRGTRR
jgi:hypothetical protein